jgi:hypothetical protein
MNHAESLLMSVRTAVPSYRHPARMLRPEQHFHIAAAYDSAAFDISFAAHTRAAFARKADWFRLLARVGEKREQAGLPETKSPRNGVEPVWVHCRTALVARDISGNQRRE